MTSAIFSQGRPMTESEFLALGETPERIELFDGSLHVTPAPTTRHQKISLRLGAALDPVAEDAGLQVHLAINVRLGPDRIPIPDLAIIEDDNIEKLVVDASAVRLICEITSPSNATTDRVLKKHYYAAAGIAWYLLIDPQEPTLRLYQLAGGVYREYAVAAGDEPLHLTEPVVATITPADLLPR